MDTGRYTDLYHESDARRHRMVYIIQGEGYEHRVRTHISALIERPADVTLLSDASYTAVGGHCQQTGVWWRYDLEEEQIKG